MSHYNCLVLRVTCNIGWLPIGRLGNSVLHRFPFAPCWDAEHEFRIKGVSQTSLDTVFWKGVWTPCQYPCVREPRSLTTGTGEILWAAIFPSLLWIVSSNLYIQNFSWWRLLWNGDGYRLTISFADEFLLHIPRKRRSKTVKVSFCGIAIKHHMPE